MEVRWLFITLILNRSVEEKDSRQLQPPRIALAYVSKKQGQISNTIIPERREWSRITCLHHSVPLLGAGTQRHFGISMRASKVELMQELLGNL